MPIDVLLNSMCVSMPIYLLTTTGKSWQDIVFDRRSYQPKPALMHVTCVVLYCKGHGAKHKKKIARNMCVRKEAGQGLKKKRAAAWSKDILKHKMTERDQEGAGDKRSAARSIRYFFEPWGEKFFLWNHTYPSSLCLKTVATGCSNAVYNSKKEGNHST